MKKFDEFVNEDLRFNGKSSHRLISDEYSVGDDIIFIFMDWDYEEQKSFQRKEKGKIIEMYDYNDDNWGTLNIKVKPENKDIQDKEGVLWIGQNVIVSKA